MSDVGTAQRVLAEMNARFGPGFSNGVAAILLHDELPSVFTADEWRDWFFKPAETAFQWASDKGLIESAGPGAWRLSAVGDEVAAMVREQCQ